MVHRIEQALTYSVDQHRSDVEPYRKAPRAGNNQSTSNHINHPRVRSPCHTHTPYSISIRDVTRAEYQMSIWNVYWTLEVSYKLTSPHLRTHGSLIWYQIHPQARLIPHSYCPQPLESPLKGTLLRTGGILDWDWLAIERMTGRCIGGSCAIT